MAERRMLFNKNDTFVPHLTISYNVKYYNYNAVYIGNDNNIKYKITGEDKNGVIEIMFKNEFILLDDFIYFEDAIEDITVQNETNNLIILNYNCLSTDSYINNCQVYGKFNFKERCINSEGTQSIHIYGPNCIFEDTAFNKDIADLYYYDKVTPITIIKNGYTNVYAHPHILYDIMKYNNVEEGDEEAIKYKILNSNNKKLIVSSPNHYIETIPIVNLGNYSYILSLYNYMYNGNYITEYTCSTDITYLRKGITLPQNATVYFPDSVTDIEVNTFENESNLKKVVIFGNCELTYLNGFRGSSLENIEIYNNKITDIKSNCFLNCVKLTKFIIPESVLTIGGAVFNNTNLKSLYIPKNVSNIGIQILNNSKNIESIIVDENNSNYDSRNNCNAIISNNLLKEGCKNTIIPNDIDTIGAFAFAGMGLKEIIIPNNIKILHQKAFINNLTDNIIIPESVTNISVDCFNGTNIYRNENNWVNGILYISNCIVSVKRDINGEITILDNTRLICESAFASLSNITKINIPNSLKYINYIAFKNMGDLIIEYDGTIEEWNTIVKGSNWDTDTNITYIFKVPNNEIWYISTNDNIINVDTEYINNNLLSNTYEDKGLLVFENNIENIFGLFRDNIELKEVWLPNHNISQTVSAFTDCTHLITVNNSKQLKSIGEDTFARCENLQQIEIDSDWIGDLAFSDCTSLTYVKISKRIEKISAMAFKNCTSLDSIDYEGTIEEWDNIQIEDDWREGSGIEIIHCTDDDINL